ncbi:BrnA antitoxin family protein [Aurantimonas sp. 22II-16-19i]|uniref:BrnA antitoxin family protein n=1 Tax=Aurantimonas sp. 22II-16-19i TaxID=1317114 RepID=UPI0009FB9299|nr:BrnA antitoxin family protein [Aurantimonas sp. 22II-16-19i]
MQPRYAKPLTIEELAALPDSEIDTSDIAALDEAFWRNARLSPPRTKPNVSLRLPEEVLNFFTAESPKGYTSRMAAVLSAYVQAHQAKR